MKIAFLAILMLATLNVSAFASPESELKALAQQILDASVKGDIAFLEEVIAEEAMNVDADGSLFSKAQDLEEIRAKKVVFKSLTMTDVKVRMMGENHAFVTGLVKSSGKFEGEAFDITARGVGCYEKKDGKWRSIFSQSTEVQPPAR
jgi:ketosteroid isomerase-like protein